MEIPSTSGMGALSLTAVAGCKHGSNASTRDFCSTSWPSVSRALYRARTSTLVTKNISMAQ